MIRTILDLAQIVPLAIAMFVAIGGAFVALIGGVAGWADVTELGKLAAGLGALGFFGWLLFPTILRSL